MAVACALATGCATPLTIRSFPEGARILDNGRDTGRVTPAQISVRELKVGGHLIAVEKEGYQSLVKPQFFHVKVSVRSIISSVILAPVYLPVNLFGDSWKDIEGLRFSWNTGGYELPTFFMRKTD